MGNWGYNWIYFNSLHSPDRIDTYFLECFFILQRFSSVCKDYILGCTKFLLNFCQKSVVYMCKSDVKYQISQKIKKLLHFIPNTKETDILFCKEKN